MGLSIHDIAISTGDLIVELSPKVVISGAKNLMCIRVLGSNRRYGHVGDVIIGVVKDATPNLTVKRSDVVRAVIVRTKQSIRRKDGSRLRFEDNASVIINKETNFNYCCNFFLDAYSTV